MKGLPKMPILRLAYVALFLMALVAVFVAWGAIAGQDHVDLLPWHIKLGLGVGIAFATVKATSAAVSGKQAWNSGSVKWFGVILLLAALCAVASWYAHVYLEEQDEEQPEEAETSASYELPPPEAGIFFSGRAAVPGTSQGDQHPENAFPPQISSYVNSAQMDCLLLPGRSDSNWGRVAGGRPRRAGNASI